MRRMAPFATLLAALAFAPGPALTQLTPTGQTPTGRTPTGRTPVGQTPTGITPTGVTPTGRTPAGITPTGRTAPGITPTGRTPFGITPSPLPYNPPLGGPPPGLVNPNVPPQEAAPGGMAFGQPDVSNRQPMSRWRQQELQRRGFGGFADPAVLARLNLNDNQVRQLNALAQQYNAQLQGIYKIGQTDPTQAARQSELARKQSLDALAGILTPAQLRAWEELTGQPFDLPPAFRPSAAGAGPSPP